MDSNLVTRSVWPGYKFNQGDSFKSYYQSPQLQQFKSIQHGFFGRQGGYSAGIFSSLNMSYGKGDSDHSVQANRAKVACHFNVPVDHLITLRQTHSCHVIEITDENQKTELRNCVGDAIITNQPNLAVGVLTADCIPILMYVPKINYVAAIHAGRVGLQLNIINQTVNALLNKGADACDIIVAIGPSIQNQSYVVDHDVVDSFEKNYPCYMKYFTPGSGSQKFHVDLVAIAIDQLMHAGIQIIDVTQHDTYANPKLFFSCRYAKHCRQDSFGNQISVIQLA